MIDVVVHNEEGQPLWLDVGSPGDEELGSLAERYGLHPAQVQDCLEPGHLPKHEKHGETTFMIIRAWDEGAGPDADTVPSMTRKVALFLGNRFLLTIHRRSLPFLAPILEHYRDAKEPIYLQLVLLEVLAAAVETFHAPLEEIEEELHGFEQAILRGGSNASNRWEDIFRTKSRLMVIKRILWHSQSTVQKFIPFSSANIPLCQDLRERIESLDFFATGMLDDLNSLLSIQLSLVSNRTNEVMKVLTIFSIFFMPVTFIVGVYGMNFSHIPEYRMPHGYLWVWTLMLAVDFALFLWVRRKGWL
jgi:magnesium transporter